MKVAISIIDPGCSVVKVRFFHVFAIFRICCTILTLREKLSQISNLGVILDEVHHSYGITEDGEKKLRTAVNILNQHGNVVSVLGMSGTPYVKNTVKVGNDEIKLNQIQDVVYNYPLNHGIGNFLKIPDVRKREVKERVFLKEALTVFFKDFDIKYMNGTNSKIAFYCPGIIKLNDNIFPVIKEWYQENRPGKEDEIFRFYRVESKADKKYSLPRDSEAVFNNLDKPYSTKRVILLVAIGTEGWDCKSLTAVVLPRKQTSKNFVLQTTCRCLREVEDAKKEKALIYLGDGNYETLDKQLKENYLLSISDLKDKESESIKVQIRRPQLGRLKYKQISTKYEIVRRIADNPQKVLSNFDISTLKKQYRYDTQITKAKIGDGILTQQMKVEQKAEGELDYEYNDFLYDLANATYGKYSEVELLSQFDRQLSNIFAQIEREKDWFIANPYFEVTSIPRLLASSLMTEIEYKKDIITSDVEIELLEWDIPNPLMGLTTTSGTMYKFMPHIDPKDIRVYVKHPEDLDEERTKIDPNDVSFNYMPYRMDSDFERVALRVMLTLSKLSNLEVYFNGYKDDRLQSFWIQTADGVYTPDFLILKRDGKKISKVLILETKGKIYYDDEFKRKEKFVKEVFVKHNPHFKYECFIDEGENDFEVHVERLQEMLKGL